MSGKYTKELSTVYAACVKRAVESLDERGDEDSDEEKPEEVTFTKLYKLGNESTTAKGSGTNSSAWCRSKGVAPTSAPAVYMITGAGGVLNLSDDKKMCFFEE